MFKVEYKVVNKFDLSDYAGFNFIIDSECDFIEFFYINSFSEITKRKEYKINNTIKERIENIIFNNKSLFSLNSYIYLDGINKHKEQTFIFELDDLNRKIEGCNIDNNHLLVNIFNEIKDVLKDIIIINLY